MSEGPTNFPNPAEDASSGFFLFFEVNTQYTYYGTYYGTYYEVLLRMYGILYRRADSTKTEPAPIAHD